MEPREPVAPNPGPAKLFYGFLIAGGLILLPLVLSTIILSKSIKRHPFLTSFLFSWVVFSACLCLRVFANQHLSAEYSLPLCVAQASMVYGAFALVSLTTLCLVIYIWSLLRSASSKDGGVPPEARKLWIYMPYVVFIIFTAVTAIYGSMFPRESMPSLSMFYCTMGRQVNLAIIVIGIVQVTAILTFFALAVVAAIRHWTTMRQPNSQPMLSLCIRILLFTIGIFASVVSVVGFLSKDRAVARVVSLFPGWAYLCFGTQTDILRVWAPWNWFRKRSEIAPESLSAIGKTEFPRTTPALAGDDVV